MPGRLPESFSTRSTCPSQADSSPCENSKAHRLYYKHCHINKKCFGVYCRRMAAGNSRKTGKREFFQGILRLFPSVDCRVVFFFLTIGQILKATTAFCKKNVPKHLYQRTWPFYATPGPGKLKTCGEMQQQLRTREKIHTARRDFDNAINCSTGYLSNISYLMKTHVKKKHEQTYYTNAEETDRNLRSSQMQTAVKQNSISYGWFIPKKKTDFI